MSTEEEFEVACYEAIDECRRLNPPYQPTAWIQMIARHGAVEAARRLVVNSEIQSGFKELVTRNRVDLTIESAILNPRWNRLFSPEVKDAARWRLLQAGASEPS